MFSGHWNPFKALRDRRQRRKNEWGERWQVRVVVVGDSESGKSCLIQRYCSGTLPHTYTPTLFDTTTVTSTVDDKKVQMIIQDTAGQEELGNVRPPCYLHADVVVVCFSPGAAGSWERVARVWVPEARRYCGKGVPLVLVACKVDDYQGQSLSPLSPTSPITSPFTSSTPSLPSFSSSPFARRGNGEVQCEEEEEVNGFSSFVLRRDPTHHQPHQQHQHHDDDDDDESSSNSDARDSGFFEMSDRDRRASTPRASVSSSLQDVSRASVSNRLHRAAATLSQSQDICQSRAVQASCSSGHHQQRSGSEVTQQTVSCSEPTMVTCPSGDQQRGESVAREVGAVGYFETSAVRDTGIELAFQAALTAAMAAKQWRKKYMLP